MPIRNQEKEKLKGLYMKEKEENKFHNCHIYDDPTEALETLKGHYYDAKNLNKRYRAYFEEMDETLNLLIDDGAQLDYDDEITELKQICEQALKLDE